MTGCAWKTYTREQEMAHRAANGWIAPMPEELEFSVQAYGRRRELRGREHRPTGIFVHEGNRVYMDYAGVTSYWTFELPSDPDFLRDVADALRKLARDIDRRR
jgi:hypothetical protein